jgi:hypothetical protein
VPSPAECRSIDKSFGGPKIPIRDLKGGAVCQTADITASYFPTPYLNVTVGFM